MALKNVTTGSRLINTWVQIGLGVAIFLWGMYAFFYEKQYVPSHMPPSVVIASSMQEMGHAGDLMAIKGAITLRNTSKAKVWILSSWYTAYGFHITQSSRDGDGYTRWVHAGVVSQQTYFPRHFNSSAEVVVNSTLTPEGEWLEPDEEWNGQFQLYVPPGKYESIMLEVNVQAAKDKRILGTKWLVGPDKDYPVLLPGQIWIQPCVKPSETEKDPAKCELVSELNTTRFKKLETKYSLFHADSTAFLLFTGSPAAERRAVQ